MAAGSRGTAPGRSPFAHGVTDMKRPSVSGATTAQGGTHSSKQKRGAERPATRKDRPRRAGPVAESPPITNAAPKRLAEQLLALSDSLEREKRIPADWTGRLQEVCDSVNSIVTTDPTVANDTRDALAQMLSCAICRSRSEAPRDEGASLILRDIIASALRPLERDIAAFAGAPLGEPREREWQPALSDPHEAVFEGAEASLRVQRLTKLESCLDAIRDGVEAAESHFMLVPLGRVEDARQLLLALKWSGDLFEASGDSKRERGSITIPSALGARDSIRVPLLPEPDMFDFWKRGILNRLTAWSKAVRPEGKASEWAALEDVEDVSQGRRGSEWDRGASAGTSTHGSETDSPENARSLGRVSKCSLASVSRPSARRGSDPQKLDEQWRTGRWFAKATDDLLNSDMLRIAARRGSIQSTPSGAGGGRQVRRYSTTSVCQCWLEYRDRIISALAREEAADG